MSHHIDYNDGLSKHQPLQFIKSIPRYNSGIDVPYSSLNSNYHMMRL